MIFDFKAFCKEVHKVSKRHGWWDIPHKTDLECMALMTAEISEAMEELRHDPPRPPIYQVAGVSSGSIDVRVPGKEWQPHLKPEGQVTELADCVLRIIDYCEHHGFDLVQAMELKHAYNQTREYKHGKRL